MYRSKGGIKLDNKFYLDIAEKVSDDNFPMDCNVVTQSLKQSKDIFYFSDENSYNISYDSDTNTFIHFDNKTRGQTEHPLVNIFFFKENDTECYILQTKEHAQLIKVILQICPFTYKFYDIWQQQPDNITIFKDMTRINIVIKHLYETYFQKKNKIDWLLYCLERRNVSAPWL